MAIRQSHGKARVESPRWKDVPELETEREPSDDRDPTGRFRDGNRAANGSGAKALIRSMLGDPADPLTKTTVRLYKALLRGLPSDGATVRQLTAGQAREATLAAFYGEEARKAGLATPEGLKLAEAARSHDLAAQRLAVSAYDRAVRDANSQPEADPLAFLEEFKGKGRVQ